MKPGISSIVGLRFPSQVTMPYSFTPILPNFAPASSQAVITAASGFAGRASLPVLSTFSVPFGATGPGSSAQPVRTAPSSNNHVLRSFMARSFSVSGNRSWSCPQELNGLRTTSLWCIVPATLPFVPQRVSQQAVNSFPIELVISTGTPRASALACCCSLALAISCWSFLAAGSRATASGGSLVGIWGQRLNSGWDLGSEIE